MSLVSLIAKKLGYRLLIDEAPKAWLDTGHKRLHQVMGHTSKGLPYGRLYEIAGAESHGKSALAMRVAGLAQQQQKAVVLWYDAETTFDPTFAVKRGLDPDKVQLIQPLHYLPARSRKVEIISAEDAFRISESIITTIRARSPRQKFVFVVDSVAGMVTREELKSGLEFNMRTNSAIASFLSRALRKWAGVCLRNDVMMLLINQIREKPGVAFGDPRYTPGGKALKHYCSIRVYVTRGKNGNAVLEVKKGKRKVPVGILGTLTNKKNKLGVEHRKAGFVMRFDGSPDSFPSSDEVQRTIRRSYGK